MPKYDLNLYFIKDPKDMSTYDKINTERIVLNMDNSKLDNWLKSHDEKYLKHHKQPSSMYRTFSITKN